jgi:WD40 repeat protein
MGEPAATEISCLKPHGESIVCCIFIPGSDVLCTGSHDNTVMLWRVSDGWTCRLRGHTNWVTCIAAQVSGHLLATGSADETIKLWDLTSLLDAPDGVEVDSSDCTLKNYGGSLRCPHCHGHACYLIFTTAHGTRNPATYFRPASRVNLIEKNEG